MSGINPGTAVLVANLWWYSFAVIRPARMLKPFRPYRTSDIGPTPPPDAKLARGPHFHRKHAEPVLLDATPDDYQAVEAFDAVSDRYQRVMEPFTLPLFEEVVEAMAPHLDPAARILDPSCGPGAEILKLAARVPDGEVVGADLAAGMVKTAARNARDRGVRNAAFFQADVSRMPAQFAGRFDLIYCSCAFHHYPDPSAALREMLRVLRPGGHAFIVDAGPWWMKAIGSPLCKWGDPGWIAFHTGDEFQRLFLDAGFAGFHWTEILPGIGLSIGTKGPARSNGRARKRSSRVNARRARMSAV